MFFYGKINRNINQLKKNPLRVHLHCKKTKKGKRTSLFASQSGSMTVEAALVLPLLLCVFFGILLWAKVLVLNQEVETSLLETGRRLAREEYLYSREEKEGASVGHAALIFQTVRKQGDAGEGLSISELYFGGSGYQTDSKEIQLMVRYAIKIPTILFGTWKIRLRSGIIQKAWNGYAPAKGEEKTGDRSYVYVTEDGSVYHEDSQCYHLHITIQPTEQVDAYYEGKTKYRPCEHCIEKSVRAGTLYIPEEGDCYHSDPSCSGLTRTVHYVKKEDAGDKVPCSHCSGN